MTRLLQRFRRGRRHSSLPAGASVRPARDVLSAQADDRCVLLDLRAGIYLGLDEVGTRIWQSIERGATTDEVVAELALEYDASIEQLSDDTQRFVQDLHRRGLVTEHEAVVADPPAVLSCWALLLLLDLSTRLLGMRGMVAFARYARLVTAGATVRHDTALIGETMRRLTVAAAFYPRRALCLEQSVALIFLLRRRGVAADWALGASTWPFSPHAWIAVNDCALNEPDDRPLHLAKFTIPGV